MNHLPAKLIRTYDKNKYEPEKREALKRWATHISGALSGGNVTTLPRRA